MRGIGLGLILPGGVAAPGPAEQIHQRAGGDAVAVVGAYIIVAQAKRLSSYWRWAISR